MRVEIVTDTACDEFCGEATGFFVGQHCLIGVRWVSARVPGMACRWLGIILLNAELRFLHENLDIASEHED